MASDYAVRPSRRTQDAVQSADLAGTQCGFTGQTANIPGCEVRDQEELNILLIEYLNPNTSTVSDFAQDLPDDVSGASVIHALRERTRQNAKIKGLHAG